MEKREKLILLIISVIVNDLVIFIAFSAIYPYYFSNLMIFNNWLLIYTIIITLSIDWILFLYLWFNLKKKQMPLKLILKKESISIKEILIYSLIFFFIIIGITITTSLFFKTYYQITGLYLGIVLIGGITCGLTVGFVEELIWRAYLFNELKFEYGSKWRAIIITSISYSLFHGFEPLKLIMTFIIGIIRCVILDKIKTAWPIIISHGISESLWWFMLLI